MVAYERLSEPIKVLLEGLRAEHSGYEQAAGAIRDGKTVRREPVKSQHPIVRVHPVGSIKYFRCIHLKLTPIQVTKQKALFVNPGFTRRIVGLKDEESDALLKLLFKVCCTASQNINTDTTVAHFAGPGFSSPCKMG